MTALTELEALISRYNSAPTLVYRNTILKDLAPIHDLAVAEQARLAAAEKAADAIDHERSKEHLSTDTRTALDWAAIQIRMALNPEPQSDAGEATARLSTPVCDRCEIAWGIIANAGGGDWSRESNEWQKAAARWRDEYHSNFSSMPAEPASPGAGDATARCDYVFGTIQGADLRTLEHCVLLEGHSGPHRKFVLSGVGEATGCEHKIVQWCRTTGGEGWYCAAYCAACGVPVTGSIPPTTKIATNLPAEPASPDVLRERACVELRDYVLCCVGNSLTKTGELELAGDAVDAIVALAAARLGRKEP